MLYQIKDKVHIASRQLLKKIVEVLCYDSYKKKVPHANGSFSFLKVAETAEGQAYLHP